jgi:hypothetical protein
LAANSYFWAGPLWSGWQPNKLIRSWVMVSHPRAISTCSSLLEGNTHGDEVSFPTIWDGTSISRGVFRSLETAHEIHARIDRFCSPLITKLNMGPPATSFQSVSLRTIIWILEREVVTKTEVRGLRNVLLFLNPF